MADDHLKLEIHPVLLEALSIPGAEGKIDYYRFLGVNPQSLSAAVVDAAIMERTRELRRWQNSPQHGSEVVKLLPLLHRVGNILKDPVRRDAYAQELDRLRRGGHRDPLEDFRAMVRAALVDGMIDNNSKAELLRYAEQNEIDQIEAGRILKEFSSAAAAPPDESAVEADEFLKVEMGGIEEFSRSLQSMLLQGRLTATSAEKAVGAAAAFSIDEASARRALTQVRTSHFRGLVERVAEGGAISNNQARLLMPKAKMMGLEPELAYEIISRFTFTGASQDDLAQMSLVSAGFEASEIDDLLTKQETVVFEQQRPGTMSGILKALVPLGLLGLLTYGAFWAWSEFGPETRVVVTPTPTPTPAPTTTPQGPWKPPLPDPASGFLAMNPSEEGDPPAFEAKIHEVTCGEYRKFLVANLYPNRPSGWGIDYAVPEGYDHRPITGIAARDAREYCAWRARELGLPSSQVRLPTQAEYRRMIRARNGEGQHPAEPGFWAAAGLHGSLTKEAKKTRTDTLLFSNGQLYDVLGNVQEWATDAEGRFVITGGHVFMEPPGPDLDAPIPAFDGEPRNEVGFRVVIAPPTTY